MNDLLLAGDRAVLRMYAFGYDAFSGSRWMLRSEPYTFDSLKSGGYSSNTSLTVGPCAEGEVPVVPDIDEDIASEFPNLGVGPADEVEMKLQSDQPLRKLRLVKGWALVRY